MENLGLSVRRPKDNVFLVDWLTVVFHNQTVYGIQMLLGLADGSIPWSERHNFVYGYPVTTYWNHIAIRWGADDPKYYSDDPDKSAAQKARSDMGICLEISGQGCRELEQQTGVDWIALLNAITSGFGRACITRLDLAYDDHVGILNIYRMEHDVRARFLTCKSRQTHVHWSDDWDTDIQGLTIEIGSRKSDVLIRIYDKAAERGYDHSKHWIRVELQLRKDRAHAAALQLAVGESVGVVSSGILRNYCMFRVPSGDSNKCRWPIADYWSRLLEGMEKIRLVFAPGSPYNFSKTEEHMVIQYGQGIVTWYRMYGDLTSLLRVCQARFPNLAKKYENAIADHQLMVADRERKKAEMRRFYGFDVLSEDDPLNQIDIAEIFGEDCLP